MSAIVEKERLSSLYSTITLKHDLSLANDADLGPPHSPLCPQQPDQMNFLVLASVSYR